MEGGMEGGREEKREGGRGERREGGRTNLTVANLTAMDSLDSDCFQNSWGTFRSCRLDSKVTTLIFI